MFRLLFISIVILSLSHTLQAQIKVKARVDESSESAQQPKSKYEFTDNAVAADLGWLIRGTIGLGYERVLSDVLSVRIFGGPTFADPLDDRLYESFIGANTLQSVSSSPGLGLGLALRYYGQETGRFEGPSTSAGLSMASYRYSGKLKDLWSDPKSSLAFNNETVKRVNIFIQYAYAWELIKNGRSGVFLEAGLYLGYTIDRFNVLSAMTNGANTPTYTLRRESEVAPSYLIMPHLSLGYAF